MLVFTPNTTVDVTTWLAELVPGSVLRDRRTVVSGGGKGVNVCRTLRLLGHAPRLVGLSPRQDDTLERHLAAEGCVFVPFHHDGPGRLSHIVLEDSGRTTVLNGRGPQLSGPEWEALRSLVGELARSTRFVVCSGSVPPGMPEDAYGQVVSLAHERGAECLVDSGPAFVRASLSAGPDLVSPNLAEAEGMLTGQQVEAVDEQSDDVPDRCVDASRRLHAMGARRAVVTGGRYGAALTTSAGSWWLPAPMVRVVNAIGAGDTFVGGVVAALASGASDVEAVRHGIRVAAAACETETAGIFSPARLAELERVELLASAR